MPVRAGRMSWFGELNLLEIIWSDLERGWYDAYVYYTADRFELPAKLKVLCVVTQFRADT